MGLRLTMFFGIAAIGFAVTAVVVDAQTVEVPLDEQPEGFTEIAEEYAPEGWAPGSPHPGQSDFETYCGTCHTLSEQMLTGPGFQGLWQRIQEGPDYEGKNPYERVLEYVQELDPEEGDSVQDPYFRQVQEEVGGPGAQMTIRGGMPPDTDERRFLNVIDYIFRFRELPFNEREYLAKADLGRRLASGATRFKWGGPGCVGCHSIGSDPHLRGASVAQPITHTYVLARTLGRDAEANYTDGLYNILSGPDAPAMHYFYEDVEGGRPLTDLELDALMTFFEVQARETGTEEDSNYLPILALIFAALGIMLLEPGVVNLLFAKEDHEYIDGPYAGEHHGEGHSPVETPHRDADETDEQSDTKEDR